MVAEDSVKAPATPLHEGLAPIAHSPGKPSTRMLTVHLQTIG
jgi:hypothetical protein